MFVLRIIALIFVTGLLSQRVLASVVPYNRGVLTTVPNSSSPIIKNTASSYCETAITPNPNLAGVGYIDLSKKGTLTLAIDHHFPIYIKQYEAEVTFAVKRYTTLGSSPLADTTIVLKVNYFPGDSMNFRDKNVVSFKTVEKFTLQITEIKVNGSSQNELPANLFVNADVFVDRIYDFAQLNLSAPSIMVSSPIDSDCDTYKDKIKLLWNDISGAEEYQLEWTHVNNIDKNISDLEVDFRLNSTRISTTSTSYNLSMVFDKGFICFRVRAVGRSITDPTKYLFTPWSTSDGIKAVSNCVYYEVTQAFDISKNWQYSATYAEEGKRKEVVSFFDGTLRNRQTVTRINSDNNIIVGETIYDHQGRPAVQILPAPVMPTTCTTKFKENSLKYYDNFNRSTDGIAYSKVDFDVTDENSVCNNIFSKGLSKNSGTSLYYSVNNSNLHDNQAFVPDAELYPYSQVEYMPDNTGRIRRQGGVGKDFQLGSGHETMFFYGHPFQEELDRLFGSEVGFSSHYQKNMVVDANGQVSVSYLDQEGRVIATSLAGNVPDNVIPLESYGDKTTLTVDLFAKNSTGESSSNILSIDKKAKVFNQSLTLSSETDLNITYDMQISPFTDECLDDICFSCVYDLTIEVSDLCGNFFSTITSPTMTGHFTRNSTNEVVFSVNCENFAYNNSFLIENVPMGEYQISKILRINEDALEAYIDMYLNPTINDCVNTYDDLLAQEAADSDIDDCSQDMSCEACMTRLGSLLAYLENGGTEEEYNIEKELCQAPCKSISYYETMREFLLLDMFPGGQYAEYLNNNGTIQPSIFPLSVLNETNVLPNASTAHWKNPKYDVEGTIQNFYFEADGTTKSKVYLENVVFNGTLLTGSLPAVESGALLNVKVFLDPLNGEYYTYPQYLAQVKDFIELYLDNSYWSNSLVIYHPEYSYLKTYKEFYKPYQSNDPYSSESFDDLMFSVNKWQDAVTAGFINPNYLNTTVTDRINDLFTINSNNPWDPFAVYVSGNTLQSRIMNYMTINSINYSMMEVAAMMVRCPNSLIGVQPAPSCAQFGLNVTGNTSAQNQQLRDDEWMTFRGLYRSLKQELQANLAEYRSLNDPSFYGYNACIGNENFNPFENNFLQFAMPGGLSGQYFNQQQPCYNTFALNRYRYKQIRFGNSLGNYNQSPQQVAYQLYLLNGVCPIGTAFENTLNEATAASLLTSSNFAMSALPSTGNLVLAVQNYEVNGPLAQLNWQQTTISASVLEVLWTENSVPYATFRLSKNPSSAFSWSNVTSFSNLTFTQMNGAFYEFTIKAKVVVNGVVSTELLSGYTSLKIGNCSFPDVCTLNDAGKDIEKMMKLITLSGNLTSSSPINLTQAPYSTFLSSNIKYAINPSPTGTQKFYFDQGLKTFYFYDDDATLRLKITDFLPTTTNVSSLSQVVAIQKMNAGPNNTFELVCLNSAGEAFMTLTCNAIRTTNSGQIGVQMGKCGQADPILCTGIEYTTTNDLFDVLKYALENQNAPFELRNNSHWTSTLSSLLSSQPTSIIGNVTVQANGDKLLSFVLPDSCDLKLNYDINQGGLFSFDNISSVNSITLLESVDGMGNYHNFKLSVTCLYEGDYFNADLIGTTCFNLKTCKTCEKEEARSYTEQELAQIQFNLKERNILTYDKTVITYQNYLDVVNATNARLNFDETTEYLIVPLDYTIFFSKGIAHSIAGYINFATHYNEEVDRMDLLLDPLAYISEYGSDDNLTRTYQRYLEGVNKYNMNRIALGYTTMVPENLYVFAQTIYSNDCSEYLDYVIRNINVTLLAVPIHRYPNELNAKYEEGDCFNAYKSYMTAYERFVEAQQSENTCYNYEVTMPMVSYQTFIDNNLCCSANGLTILNNYINSFSSETGCPGPVPKLNSCNGQTLVDTAYCRDNYGSLYDLIDKYNISEWAIYNGDTMLLEKINFNTFIQLGYCDCVKDYMKYLSAYVFADSTEVLTLPISFEKFCGTSTVEFESSPCEKEYDHYLNCVATYNKKAIEVGEKFLVDLVRYDIFISEQLCYCVDEYCSELNMILDGLSSYEIIPDLYTFCTDQLTTPCTPEFPLNAMELIEISFTDPCVEFYESNYETNAYISFNQQQQMLINEITEKYVNHCMGAVENFSLTYEAREHHFMLYYYDQAGNLIKTIPPEGVELVDISNSQIKQAIKLDRDNKTHQVITNHRMPTTYLYNSLNQLVAQNMPDQDPMQIFETNLPNGLPIGLNTTAIQMVNQNLGYLTGYVTRSTAPLGERGYMFKTDNGGETWSQVNNMLGSDLVKIKMLNSAVGFAIGSKGLALITQDGGASWDLLNTYGSGIISDFTGIEVSTTDAYLLNANGTIYKVTAAGVLSQHLAAPQNAQFSVQRYKDFTLQGNYSSANGIVYLANILQSGQSFDAVLLNNGSTIQMENIQVASFSTFASFGTNEIVAAGIDGNMSYLTGNSASNFTQRFLTSSVTGNIDQLYMLNAQVGICRVEENMVKVIKTTIDGGTTWNALNGNVENPTISMISQGSGSMQIQLVGYKTSEQKTEIKTLVLTTTGTISEIEHTPNLAQNLQFQATTTCVSGNNRTVYAIGSDNKLYKSNTINQVNGVYNFTVVNDAGTIALGAVKQLVVNPIPGGLDIVVLKSNGQPFRSTYTSSSNQFTTFTNVGSTLNLSQLTTIKVSGIDFVVGFNTANSKLYAKAVNNNTFYSFSTTISLGGELINAVSNSGGMIHLGGMNGGLYSSGILSAMPTANDNQSVSFTKRLSHRMPVLNKMMLTNSAILVSGNNGVVLTRALGTNPTQLVLRPMNTASNLYAANEVNNGTTIYLIGGANGFAEQFSSTWINQGPMYTTSMQAMLNHLNGKTVHDIAVKGTSVYFVGSSGSVYHTSNFGTDLFTATASVSNERILSIDFFPTAAGRAIAVGSNSTILRYSATNGTITKRIFGARYTDVHFQNGNDGTVVGHHFTVRTTNDGGNTWSIGLPSTLPSNINCLTKAWTRKTSNNQHFALLGGANYLVKYSSNIFTPISFTGNVTDIQLNSTGDIKGYLSADNQLYKLSLQDQSGVMQVTLSSSVHTAPGTIRALHLFENRSVVLVGDAGFVNYYKFSTTSPLAYNLTTIAGANLKDVYFHDNKVGYSVGENGKFYHLIATSNDPLTHDIPNGALSYTQQNINDQLLGTSNAYTITAIAFSTRTKGIYGGSYTNSSDITTKRPMVRSLKHEGDLYTAKFYYDRLGRIVVSQNSRQYNQNKYSYTLYDALGRVVEAGEKLENSSSNPQFASVFGAYVGGSLIPSVIDDSKLDNWLATQATTTRAEITRSYYDVTNPGIAQELPITLNGATQRKRIVHVTYETRFDGNDRTYDHATHYDYDIHGNVKTVLQDNRAMLATNELRIHRFKRTDYVYDLVSGNVHRVDYQNDSLDQWHHQYAYDADNRITEVFTSVNTPITGIASSLESMQNEVELSPFWNKEADYTYYDHGPLARTELGQHKVQGLDYVYTLQGWMKSVNSNTLSDDRDPGRDGFGLSANYLVAKDVMGYSLHYFDNDLPRVIGYNNAFTATQDPNCDLRLNSSDLYNGNIARMVTTITDPNTREVLPIGMAYQYDQLQRLKNAVGFTDLNQNRNVWDTYGGRPRYLNSFTYDANGNIMTQLRQDKDGSTIDDMTYQYKDIFNDYGTTDPKKHNRLYNVRDNVNYNNSDIHDMDPGINGQNYAYDEEGRLIADQQEEIEHIIWRVDGKVKAIVRPLGSQKKTVSFDYDAMGHRIAKHVYTSNGTLEKSEYYILDAQGNTLALYELLVDAVNENLGLAQTEKMIYGSARLGANQQGVNLHGLTDLTYAQSSVSLPVGVRTYELSNHLGNVLTVLSDKPIPHDNGSGAVDYYLADIRHSGDFSPFGVELEGRTFDLSGAAGYRYGFQGQEHDDEVKGDGNSVNYKYRMHDPRLGRFFAIDPLAARYPDVSPYAFVSNSPLIFVDSDGREIILAGDNKEENDKQLAVLQKLTNDKLAYDLKTKVVYIVTHQTENSNRTLNMGTSLLRSLIDDKKDKLVLATRVAHLSPGVEGAHQQDAQNGKGADAKVNMTYGKKIKTNTLNVTTGVIENIDTPEEILLGHELIHAWRIMNGMAIPKTQKENYKYNIGNGVVTKREEIEELRTVGLSPSAQNTQFIGCDEKYTENGLREEQGYGPRLNY